MGVLTVLWEKWAEFKRDFLSITASALIMPILYLVVFGLGVQMTIDGQPYLHYLIPGVVAMTTMNVSFGAIAQNLNIQRLYEKAFDQVMISPTPLWQFILGQVIAGALRGLYAAVIIILIVWPVHTGLVFNALSFFILFLNGTVFSALGVLVSFLAKSHAAVPRFSSYFITPMAFLCNTFFSTDNLPAGIRQILGILPLSQASAMVRRIAWKETINLPGTVILLMYLAVLLAISLIYIYRKTDY